MAQRVFGLLARLEVHEGEQHAWLIANLDRLARHHDMFARTARLLEAGFHLRDGLALAQPLDRQLAALRALEHIDLIDRTADHLFSLVAGELQEALVDLHIAQVSKPADHRRRRVGREHTLKARLGLGAPGLIG